MDFAEYFYSLVKQIPKGRVSTYGALARALGDIRASRAVGRMLNENPYAPVVPCHRVVMSDGSIGGFGTGVPRKIKLLEGEGVHEDNEMIKEFEDVYFDDFSTNYPLKKLRKEQRELAKAVNIQDEHPEIKTIGGVDVAYNKNGFGALVVFDYEKKEIIQGKVIEFKPELPYIPTYLAFRELPVIKQLLRDSKVQPDVLLVDGNGILHPYGMGVASHVGVKLEIPTIGVAKSLLCGKPENELKFHKDHSKVMFEGKMIGYSYLSSKRATKPIYISPGHNVSFETSLDIVTNFCNYKLPEPIREAHSLATRIKNLKKS